MKKINKILKILIVLSIFIVCVSAVSATEDGNTVDEQMSNNVYVKNITCENDFTNISTYDYVCLNITNDINITHNKVLDVNSKDSNFIINGNGHTIKFFKPKETGENHFLIIGENGKVFMQDLTLSGFNTPIINKGSALLSNITFIDNRVKYIIASGDEAGAIKSYGLLVCNNCSFINNFGLYAGAIYGMHGAITHLNNCSFTNNTYSKTYGSDMYNFNDAVTYINGVLVEEAIIKGVTVAFEQVSTGTEKILCNSIDAISVATNFIVSFTIACILTRITSKPSYAIISGWIGGFLAGMGLNVGYKYYNSSELANTTEMFRLAFIHGLTSISGTMTGHVVMKYFNSRNIPSYYKIDGNGRPVLDENGNMIKIREIKDTLIIEEDDVSEESIKEQNNDRASTITQGKEHTSLKKLFDKLKKDNAPIKQNIIDQNVQEPVSVSNVQVQAPSVPEAQVQASSVPIVKFKTLKVYQD